MNSRLTFVCVSEQRRDVLFQQFECAGIVIIKQQQALNIDALEAVHGAAGINLVCCFNQRIDK
ncbi:hypothetical protein PC39_00555 [Salinisphaera sp. PC39]